jgi:nicotinate phosphoribosyltransferase
MAGDVLTLAGEPLDGEALIHPVMRGGRRIAPPVPLNESRAHALRGLKSLPEALKKLEPAPAYPVRIAEAIQQLARQVDAEQFHSRDQPLVKPRSPGGQASAD